MDSNYTCVSYGLALDIDAEGDGEWGLKENTTYYYRYTAQTEPDQIIAEGSFTIPLLHEASAGKDNDKDNDTDKDNDKDIISDTSEDKSAGAISKIYRVMKSICRPQSPPDIACSRRYRQRREAM